MNRRKRLPRFSPLALTLLLFLSTPSNGQDSKEWIDPQYNACVAKANYVLLKAKELNNDARGRKIHSIDVTATKGGVLVGVVSLPETRQVLRLLAVRVGVVATGGATGGASVALYTLMAGVTIWDVRRRIVANINRTYDTWEAGLEKVSGGAIQQCQADAKVRYAGRVGLSDEAENSDESSMAGGRIGRSLRFTDFSSFSSFGRRRGRVTVTHIR